MRGIYEPHAMLVIMILLSYFIQTEAMAADMPRLLLIEKTAAQNK